MFLNVVCLFRIIGNLCYCVWFWFNGCFDLVFAAGCLWLLFCLTFVVWVICWMIFTVVGLFVNCCFWLCDCVCVCFVDLLLSIVCLFGCGLWPLC